MRKTAALALALLLLTGACGGESGPDAGDRSLLGEKKDHAADRSDGKTGTKNKEDGGGKGDRSGGGKGETVVAGGAGAIPEEVDVPGADEDKAYPTASSELSEPQPDSKSQGITPGYAEILGVSVEGLGDEFRITMLFNGEVPQEMPNDKTIMVVGFQLLRGKENSYAFAGQATDEGWHPYAGGKSKQTDFPGKFEVSGKTITMRIPWTYVEGAYPFKWLATSNWFQSLANTTHYLFDLAPNKGQANYPG